MQCIYNLKIALSLLLFFITQTAFSWDSTGHRVISAIAYEALTPATKQKVDTLTQLLDPGYPPLSRFLYSSTLPDQWRDSGSQHSSSWHFINTPWSTDGTPTYPAQTPNIVSSLQANQTILSSTTHTDTEKSKALAYIIHLTEDAHQPLHSSNYFSKAFPHGDAGGNAFSIRTRFAKNLHAYWDQSARQMKQHPKQRYPFTQKQVLQLAHAIQANYPKTSFGNRIYDLSVTHWTAEGVTIAQKKIYTIAPGSKLSTEYKKTQQTLAAQQMALAGYRLAALLDQIMSQDPGLSSSLWSYRKLPCIQCD